MPVETIKKILSYFLLSRIIFLVSAYLAIFLLPQRLGYLGEQIATDAPYLAWVWANFDGRHFLAIASQGYHNTNFAFFPFYPSLISLMSHLNWIPPLYIGIAISIISVLLGSFYLYKISNLDFNSKISYSSVILLSFFPLSFFYHSVYSDAVFFLLTTASFYYARQGRWFLSGFAGFLSLLTRLSGIALIPALLVEWYLQNKPLVQKDRNKALVKFSKTGFRALLFTGMGIVAYMAYLQMYFGDFLLFQKSFSAWQQDGFIFPPQVVYRYLKIFIGFDFENLVYYIAILEFVSLVFYAALSIFVLRKIRVSYGVFMIILLSLVPFTGTFSGNPRYILHLFPAFLAMAVLSEKNKKLKIAMLSVFMVLGFILTALFTRGYFIS